MCSKTTDQQEEGTVTISYSAHPMLVHSAMTQCTTASVSKGTGRDPNRQHAESSQCWSWQRLPSGTTVSRERRAGDFSQQCRDWTVSNLSYRNAWHHDLSSPLCPTSSSRDHSRAPNTDILTGTQQNASLDMASSFLQHRHQLKTPQKPHNQLPVSTSPVKDG